MTDHGVLGAGAILEYATAIDELSNAAFDQLVMGDYNTCGLRADGRVACRGFNSTGQIGLLCSGQTCDLTSVPLP